MNMYDTLAKTITESWQVLGQMSPHLLLGFLVAGVLSVCISPEWVERHLGRRGWGPVLKASLFGVPLPLCLCGVIPVSASIRRHGASRAATTSFLLSTPQTGVDSIAVTYALLGPVFAIFRPVAALLTGVVGGGLVPVVEATLSSASSHAHASAEGGWFHHASAIALLAVLAFSYRPRAPQGNGRAGADKTPTDVGASCYGRRLELLVTGMTCGHCAETVRRVFAECVGVQSVEVDLDNGRATVTGEGLDGERLVAAAAELGYAARVLDGNDEAERSMMGQAEQAIADGGLGKDLWADR